MLDPRSPLPLPPELTSKLISSDVFALGADICSSYLASWQTFILASPSSVLSAVLGARYRPALTLLSALRSLRRARHR